jgi:hypothetical protein
MELALPTNDFKEVMSRSFEITRGTRCLVVPESCLVEDVQVAQLIRKSAVEK